jgi:hypothetical protein
MVGQVVIAIPRPDPIFPGLFEGNSTSVFFRVHNEWVARKRGTESSTLEIRRRDGPIRRMGFT